MSTLRNMFNFARVKHDEQAFLIDTAGEEIGEIEEEEEETIEEEEIVTDYD